MFRVLTKLFSPRKNYRYTIIVSIKIGTEYKKIKQWQRQNKFFEFYHDGTGYDIRKKRREVWFSHIPATRLNSMLKLLKKDPDVLHISTINT